MYAAPPLQFEEFSEVDKLISDIDAATTCERVFAIISAHLKLLGFEYFVYDLIRAPKEMAPLYFTTFPRDYVERYISQRYARYDIIANYSATTIRPFKWNEVPITQLSPGQELLRRDVVDSGLKNGAMVPIHGPGSAKAYVSVSNSLGLKEFEELFEIRRHELQLIATYMHERVIELQSKSCPIIRPRLTNRESDIMVWVAMGKTNSDISVILNISESTVRDHIKNIFKKLDVFSKAQAVAVALGNGYISL